MDQSIYQQMNTLEQRHWWFSARRRIIADLINHRISLGANATILEVGCGTGGNLEMLASFGSVRAFELDDKARQLACKKSGLVVVPGYLPDALPFAGERFSFVTMLDVLEHIADDKAALEALAQRMGSGSTLLLTVPANPWLWSAHDKSHHHHRRYTKDSLRTVLDVAGYDITYISYYNTLLFPLALIVRLFGKVGDSMPSQMLNHALYFVFSLERWLMRYMSLPFGLSLFALASPRASR